MSFNLDVNALAQQIQPAVETVAKSLGTNAENLWAIGIKAQIGQGIVCGIFALICLILLALMPKVYRRLDEDFAMPVVILSSLFLLILFPILTYFAVMHLVAPEFMLLKEILGMAGIN